MYIQIIFQLVNYITSNDTPCMQNC